MTMTTATRAPKGGTTGMNGEQYAGGCFLPTTTLSKMTRSQGKPSTRVASILDGVRGFLAFSFDKSVCEISASDYSLAYYGKTRNEVQAIVDRYNAGER
jgi:hypothetical protein